MTAWIDEPTWVLVEFDRDTCYLHDPTAGRRRQFLVTGVAELEPYTPGLVATPRMAAAWERFCAWMGRDR